MNMPSNGESSSNQLTMMSIADIRAYVTAELNRLKDDVSELYDRLNAFKEAAAADKLQVITQMSHEFQAFNNRLNDFNVAIQRVIGDIEHADSTFTDELRRTLLEVDNRVLRCRAELHNVDISGDLQAFETRLDSVDKSITEIKKAVKALGDSDKMIKSKIQKLGFRIGLVIAALLWLADKFGPDIIKSGVTSLVGTKQENTGVKQQPPAQQPAIDTTANHKSQ